MPHRPRTHNPRPTYGKKYTVSLSRPTSVKERKMEDKLKKDVELIVPNSIAGQLTSKRYAELRSMKGMTMGDVAALCMMHERGEFPGDLLFDGKRKELLHPRYKKLRIKTRKELQAKWLVMRAERLAELDAAKKIVAEKVKSGEIELPESQKPLPKRKAVKGVRKTPGKPRKPPAPNKDVPPPKKSPESSYTNGNLPSLNSPHHP